ncbi:universal stress protein [Nioella aestuarii]|uniref:universal stress protein n=1 Tax=Nioella aestuarii TaxID=1662864 RepID=UPI003D7F90ED
MSKSFVVATDMSPRSDRAIRRAIWLAEHHDARLIVCHVVDDAAPPEIAASAHDAAVTLLNQFTKSLSDKVDITIHAQYGDPTADILALVAQNDPTLLILGTHRPRPFLDAVRETTAQRLVRLTACPVLMVSDRVDHAYDHVLAATDFSPASTAAITLALHLAPKAQITPVHAFHVPYSGLMTYGGQDMDEMTASFRLEATEDEARWRDEIALPDACGPTVIAPGSVSQVLAAQLAATGASLITAGAHGRVGQGRALLGSVAADLLRQPPCDVLIARPA